MLSINIYDLINDSSEFSSKEVTSFDDKVECLLNDYNETLRTVLSCDGLTVNGYTGLMLSVDKVYNQAVRVKGELLQSVIFPEVYRAYYKANDTGNLVALCKSEKAEIIKNILSDKFNLRFERHPFNIMRIIEESNDVRKAKFNVKIETVTDVSVKGQRVNDTNYYEKLFNHGDLNAVIVASDTPSQTVTFRIDKEGKILLYSQISENDIINLVEQLLGI